MRFMLALVTITMGVVVPSGCASDGLQMVNPHWTTAAPARQMRHANCVTHVWASVPGGVQPSVIGYNSAGATCTVLTSANAIPFGAPYSLATDRYGYLYVADAPNARVVVFDSSGNYWSTLNVSPGKTPQGVCVSRQGVVGVANYNSGGTENVDFFTGKGPQNSASSPSNSATGNSFLRFCSFDKRGDFFADPGTQLYYLRYSNVNTPNAVLQTCTDPVCTTGDFWAGMYSHIRSGNVNTLSVGDSTLHEIMNFKVSLGAPNLLTFTSWSTPITSLTNYPSGDICQIAPTTGQGTGSTLYISDCGTNVYQVQNVTSGGIVALFVSQAGSFGVATRPTGQY